MFQSNSARRGRPAHNLFAACNSAPPNAIPWHPRNLTTNYYWQRLRCARMSTHTSQLSSAHTVCRNEKDNQQQQQQQLCAKFSQQILVKMTQTRSAVWIIKVSVGRGGAGEKRKPRTRAFKSWCAMITLNSWRPAPRDAESELAFFPCWRLSVESFVSSVCFNPQRFCKSTFHYADEYLPRYFYQSIIFSL